MVYRLQKQQRLYVSLLIFLGVIFLFWVLYKDNISVSNGDVITQSSNFENLIKSNLKNGISFWNPYVYSGTVFLGNPLSSIFYPLNLLNYIMPYVISYKIIVFLSLVLSSLFMFFYLRYIKRSYFASFVGALTYTYSGMFITWLFIPSFIGAIMWFPLALLLIEIMITKEKYYYGVLLSVVFAAQILSGGLQIFFNSLFICLAYFILRLFYVNKKVKEKYVIRQGKNIVLFLVLGFTLCSLFLLPILEFGSQSIRSGGVSFEDASLHSIPVYGFVNLIMPNFFGNPNRQDYWAFWKGASFSELSVYMGIGALLFACIAFIFFRDKYVKIFGIIALFCVLYALGKNFFLFKFFYNAVPGFNLFRVPARMMIFFIFSLSVMSSVGLDCVLSGKIDKKSFSRFIKINYILVGLSFLSLVLFVLLKQKIITFGQNMLNKIYYANLDTSRVGGQNISFFASKIPLVYKEILASLIIFTFIYFLFIFLIDLKSNKKIKLNRFKVFLVLLLIFDLWIFSATIIKTESYNNLYLEDDVVSFLRQNAGIQRVVYLKDPIIKSSNFPPEYLTLKNKIFRVDGCEGIALSSYSNFICEMSDCAKTRNECIIIDKIENKNFLNLLNVGYIVSEKKVSGYPEVFSDGTLHVYKNTQALPRAFIVHNYLVVEDSNKILELMSKKDFDPFYYVLFDQPVNYSAATLGFNEDENAVITKYMPNRIEVEANLKDNGFLVLSEVNYVGWNVYVDGRLTPILNADYMFRSVYLESGRHNVVFEYRPASFRLGLYLSIISALALLVIFVYLYNTRRKK